MLLLLPKKSVSNPIKRIVEEIGLKTITACGLRHTHATISLSKQIPLKTIAERLRNTPEMVLRVYGQS